MMGYVPPAAPFVHPRLGVLGGQDDEPPIRLNLDRHGMPRDYATYVWTVYGRVVSDDSPARRAFLQGPTGGEGPPDFGLQEMWR